MRAIAVGVLGFLVAMTVQAQSTAITLGSADQQKLGIVSRRLTDAHVRASIPAYVRVLDPSKLATLNADLTAARAAATASSRDAERLARLADEDESASRQAAEAAAAQAVGDAARADALARRMSVEWAPALAQMRDVSRTALIRQLTEGAAVLLRADTATRPGGHDAVLSITPDAGVARAAETLGAAGAMDPRMQTFGVLAVLRGHDLGALPPGRMLDGRVSYGDEQEGVVIPRAAVVRVDGADWAYVRTGPESFERRETAEAIPTADGWFLRKGFTPGQDIVVEGAGALLAIERADEAAEVD